MLAWEDDSDYQGDSHALLKHLGEYGFLTFGWGSCSGCDAMEAAYGDRAEQQSVHDNLCNSIVWFDALGDAKAHVAGRSTENHYACSGDSWKVFAEKVANLSECPKCNTVQVET